MDGTMSTKQEQSSKVEGSGRKKGVPNKTTKLMKEGTKLVFVFDGEAPELKKAERERRNKLKEEAQAKYQVANLSIEQILYFIELFK